MTENDLCNLAISEMENWGFMTCAECFGWDIIFSRSNILVGVQAKLKLNLHAIAQCLEQDNTHFKVIIYQDYPEKSILDFLLILSRLKIMSFQYNEMGGGWSKLEKPLLFYRHKPKTLPAGLQYVFDTRAGIQSPKTIKPRSLNLVNLQIAWENSGRKPMKFYDLKNAGLDKPYNKYLKFIPEIGCWQFRDYALPSKFWPHIYAAITKGKQGATD